MENPWKLLSIYDVLSRLYNNLHFIDQWTVGSQVNWGDEALLPQILLTLKSGVWTVNSIKYTLKILSLKCSIHDTWMMVYDNEGIFFPPILCLSQSKTTDGLGPLLTEGTDAAAVTEQAALSVADLSVGAPSTPATEVPVLSPYEQQRLASIRLNEAKLASLGLAGDAALPSSSSAALMLQPPVSDCLHSTSDD